MTAALPPFESECFFITPIGQENSDVRRRADAVLDAIVKPAAQALSLTAIRADRIGEGGQVNLQVIEHVCQAATAVADLTGANLNVYYEVGMRHTCRLPLVIIADESERDKLPFDLLVQRTIFFTDDMRGVAACHEQAVEQLRAGVAGAIDSPIDAAVNIRAFQQGDAVERTLAELVTSVDGLTRQVARPTSDRVSPLALRDLLEQTAALRQMAAERDDDELRSFCDRMDLPVQHIMRRIPLNDGPPREERAAAAPGPRAARADRVRPARKPAPRSRATPPPSARSSRSPKE